MKLIPLADKVVVKQVEAEEKTKAGVLITSQSKEKPQMAVVVAVGPGGDVNGNEVKMVVKPGDKIIFSKYAASEVKVDGEDYLIMRQNDILAIVEE